ARTEKEELAVLMERLGSLWTEERIEAADTGFGARDEMKKLVQGRESLQQRRNVMDDERERLGQLLEESRAEREAVSAKRLADDERLRLEETLHKKDELERKRKEKKELEERLAHASSLPSHLPFYGGTALGTGGVVWMISNEQWIAGAVLAILTAGFAFSILRSGRGTQLDQLKKELASLTEELRQVNGAGIEGAEKAKLILQEDDRTRESEVVVKDRLAQSERAFDEAVEQTEAVRQQLKSIDRKIGEWCAAYHFPGKLGPEQLSETFERVEEAKTRIRRRRRADEIGQSIEIELEKRENKIRNMCRVFGIDYENSASAVSRMAERIEEQEDLQYKKEHLHENSHEYKRRIGSLKEKIQRYQRECNDLMRQAETESEEAYRRKGKAWQESRSLLKEITALQAKIETLIPEEAERKQTIEAVFQSEGREEDEISRCEKEVKELESQEQSLFERRAALNEQKKQLEEGGTYSELLHELERKKDHFRNETRKWAVYRTAEHLLQMAKERYRDKRLPKVVETASKFFVLMTDGRYSAVFAPKDEGFVVERMDGVRFLPSQLSRGTAEQLYLALRLALARIYQSPSPYPLIMDDILVNFDSFRTKKAVEAVREAAHHHQILLFTCHAHLLEHFPDNMIVPIEQTTLSAQ
ncbi:MAG TPA: hypothetical protein VF199_09055, partial [Bacillales bacterium]